MKRYVICRKTIGINELDIYIRFLAKDPDSREWFWTDEKSKAFKFPSPPVADFAVDMLTKGALSRPFEGVVVRFYFKEADE